MTFYKTFGIFSERALRPSEAFAYEEIDSAVKVDVGVNFPMDFDKWFENRFDPSSLFFMASFKLFD